MVTNPQHIAWAANAQRQRASLARRQAAFDREYEHAVERHATAVVDYDAWRGSPDGRRVRRRRRLASTIILAGVVVGVTAHQTQSNDAQPTPLPAQSLTSRPAETERADSDCPVAVDLVDHRRIKPHSWQQRARVSQCGKPLPDRPTVIEMRPPGALGELSGWTSSSDKSKHTDEAGHVVWTTELQSGWRSLDIGDGLRMDDNEVQFRITDVESGATTPNYRTTY